MNFLHDILLSEFPAVRVRFAEDALWYRLWLHLVGNDKDVMSTNGHSLYVSSPERYASLSEDQSTATLAHEYVHLWQRAYGHLYYMKRLLPVIVVLCLLFIAYSTGALWVSGLAVLPLLPIYNPWVARFEFDAYRMSMLVHLCLENNRHPLPASAYALYTFSDEAVQFIVDGIFSATYGMQWAPAVLRRRFRRKLSIWRQTCAENYFQSRLAFEKESTYLDIRTRLLQTIGEPYVTILMYLLAERKRI